jgi:hypothetical protein
VRVGAAWGSLGSPSFVIAVKAHPLNIKRVRLFFGCLSWWRASNAYLSVVLEIWMLALSNCIATRIEQDLIGYQTTDTAVWSSLRQPSALEETPHENIITLWKTRVGHSSRTKVAYLRMLIVLQFLIQAKMSSRVTQLVFFSIAQLRLLFKSVRSEDFLPSPIGDIGLLQFFDSLWFWFYYLQVREGWRRFLGLLILRSIGLRLL